MKLKYPVSSRIAAISVCVIGLVLGGCGTMQPQPVSKAEIAQRVLSDRAKMFSNQEPLRGPLSFPDAAARAIKYNLDFRLRQMETALQAGLTDLSNWDMLPKLVASAGYSTRNNDLASQSFNVNNGVLTNPNGNTFTGSQERTRLTAGVDLSWNLLDFGVSYYRAKQQGDQRLIAAERSRRVSQNIVQDTNIAFWRALGAQRLLSQVESTMKRAESALQRARQIESQGLMPQAQALAYQRALLDATTLLAFRRQDLELAKLELSTLMNLPPGSDYTLADEREVKLPGTPSDIARLEDLALKQRPELVEEDYKARITANEAKKQFWSILPGLGVNLGFNHDNNRYLYNANWAEAGLRLGMNLLKIASLPAQNRVNQAQLQVDDMRRLSQGMAIMSQVRIAAMRYNLAVMELGQVEESARVDQRLLNYAKAAQTTRVDSELEVIRNEARAVLSSYQRHVAYANAQAAWARLYNSVGYDISELHSDMSLGQLSNVIERSLTGWRAVTFGAALVTDAPSFAAVNVSVENVNDPAMQEAVRAGLVEAFKRHNVPVTDAAGAHRVVASLDTQSVENGVRKASYQMTVFRPNGTVSGRTNFSSTIPGQVTASALSALTQSAIDANAPVLVEWLQGSANQVAVAPIQESVGQLANVPQVSVPQVTLPGTLVNRAASAPVIINAPAASLAASAATAGSQQVAKPVTQTQQTVAPTVYRPTLRVQ